MKKSTDLNSVKEVARCLLYTDVHKVENYSFIVKHPFTDSAFATIVKNPDKVTENAVINILESESNLNRWREYVAEQIDSAESADEIYCRITKPYRLTFMKYAGQYLSEKDFAEMLCSAWITSENPNSDVNVSQSELLRMFRSADKSLLMTAEERKRLDELDNPVTVYRGVTPYNAKSVKAMSWTLDYSTDPTEGYLSEKGLMALRSSFAKDIFAQDLLCEYKKQTEHRDALKVQSREVFAELIAKINSGTYDNPQVENLLQTLAKRLAVTNGKKQYGYLRKDIKEIINSIVDEIGKDERIATLYDLWYESRETALKVYTESQPERLPLSQYKEFKSVKNIVIAEALKLNLPTDEIEETDEPTEPDCEPTVEETESLDPPPPPMDEYERTVADADKGNKWSQYRAAKFMLDRDGEHYDPKKAVEYLTKSAKQGYTVAKYMLGKLYLRGEDVPKQMLHALHWLESAVKDDNPYAEYLLGKTFLKGEDIERDTERAESLLSRSAEQGNKYAAYTLGKAYLDGDILAQNIDKAVRLLNLSASKGFAPAQFILGRLLYQGEVIPKDIKKAAEWLDRAAAQKNPYAAYLAGKIYLTEDEVKDIQKAIRSFIIAAENGNDYAEYQLGKIYLYGKDVPRDTDTAMYYLQLAAEHGNPYAAQLTHSIKVNGNWTAALASLRLLGHIARIIKNRIEDKRKGGGTDRKLLKKIEEKKQAQGLKQ